MYIYKCIVNCVFPTLIEFNMQIQGTLSHTIPTLNVVCVWRTIHTSKTGKHMKYAFEFNCEFSPIYIYYTTPTWASAIVGILDKGQSSHIYWEQHGSQQNDAQPLNRQCDSHSPSPSFLPRWTEQRKNLPPTIRLTRPTTTTKTMEYVCVVDVYLSWWRQLSVCAANGAEGYVVVCRSVFDGCAHSPYITHSHWWLRVYVLWLCAVNSYLANSTINTTCMRFYHTNQVFVLKLGTWRT